MGMTWLTTHVVLAKNLWSDKMNTERVIRMAFARAEMFKDIDTCAIIHLNDYLFLEALYSPLVQFSVLDGQMYSSAARTYETSPDWIHFELRDDIVTIDGYHVTAEDAAFSLKRLMLCNSNMHGNVSSFLDVGTLKNIDDNVDGIVANGFRLSLRIKAEPQLVLAFLSSIDFAVIPKIAIDRQSLKIKDQRNTTGPYYLSEGEDPFLFSLRAKTGHWSLKKNSPELINVLPSSSPEEIVELFEKGEIDFVGQPMDVAIKDKVRLSRIQGRDAQLHKTDHLFLITFAFSDKGMTIPTAERIILASRLQEIYRKKHLQKMNIDGDFSVDTQFLLLDSAFGGLRNDDREKCKELQSTAIGKNLPKRKIRISVPQGTFDDYVETYSEISENVEFVVAKPSTHKENLESKDFDLFQIRFDISDKEDTTLIAMLFHLGFFRPTDESIFMRNYVTESSPQKRERMLQNLHINAVCKNPTIVPLAKTSLLSVAQNGWYIPFPEKFIGTPFFDLQYRRK